MYNMSLNIYISISNIYDMFPKKAQRLVFHMG